ncbi:MAG: pilus assembly protein PilV [Sulfuricella sp.]|nr:pilus assembly protein PilV [Sulfuricella sp.]
MKTFFSVPTRQSGSMLLEALISILIFSMGILAIVGMQAASIRQAGDAKYRIDANLLVNQLIGQMWVSNRNAATLAANFASPGGAAYVAWVGSPTTPGTVQAILPGADANPPTVAIVQVPGTTPPLTATSLVTITVFWQPPGDEVAHQHVVIAQIK